MELCGVPCPNELDGNSFASLLNDPDDPSWEDVAYTYYRHVMSVRTPQYRLARIINNGTISTELYKYGEDRIEYSNVADKYPEVVNEMLPIWNKGLTEAFQ